MDFRLVLFISVILGDISNYDSTRNKKCSCFWSSLNFPPTLRCRGTTSLAHGGVQLPCTEMTDDNKVAPLTTTATRRLILFCPSALLHKLFCKVNQLISNWNNVKEWTWCLISSAIFWKVLQTITFSKCTVSKCAPQLLMFHIYVHVPYVLFTSEKLRLQCWVKRYSEKRCKQLRSQISGSHTTETEKTSWNH